MAGDRFVHTIVDNFGSEMVERAFVDAANIHPRSLANRLETFENLDCRGIIVTGFGLGWRVGTEQIIRHVRSYKSAGVTLARDLLGLLPVH